MYLTNYSWNYSDAYIGSTADISDRKSTMGLNFFQVYARFYDTTCVTSGINVQTEVSFHANWNFPCSSQSSNYISNLKSGTDVEKVLPVQMDRNTDVYSFYHLTQTVVVYRGSNN